MLSVGTVSTEHYLDSQDTIINDLRDTFNWKYSAENSNILSINTSTYCINRTANHIDMRINDAEKRVKSIQASLHKSGKESRGNSQNIKNHINMSKIRNGNLFSETNEIVTHKQMQKFYAKSQAQLIQIIKAISYQLKEKKNKIQQLDEKLIKAQQQYVKKQQKYLKVQYNLRLEIQRLNNLLQAKFNYGREYHDEKVELERLLDEHKLRVYSMESKLKQLEENKVIWLKKQGIIKKTMKRFEDLLLKQQQSQTGMKTERKNTKQLIQIMKNVVNGGKQNEQSENKENQYQWINKKCNNQHNDKQLSQAAIVSYRSCAIESERQQRNPHSHRTIKSSQNQENSINQQLYRMLTLQAATIQKFM